MRELEKCKNCGSGVAPTGVKYDILFTDTVIVINKKAQS